MSADDGLEPLPASPERIDGLVREVNDRIQWNIDAYGKAWTGEDEDTRFIVGPLLDEIRRLLGRLSRCPSPERDTEKLVEALFEAKGAIPSDRGELHRRLGRVLAEFSDASKEER